MARPDRRSDFDVTDTVRVSSPAAVREVVLAMVADTWPGIRLHALDAAFQDFERLFSGQLPGYLGVDTVYHDRQHSLDMVLATARLLAGHERSHSAGSRLGAQRAIMGLITALFHDSGYIRTTQERDIPNGAVFTRQHVTRSARYLAGYLQNAGFADQVPVATRIVHFTGYELPLELIRIADPRDRTVGHLLGTADMLAQLADRCYLEKCRDRLYAEFVLGDIAVHPGPHGMKVLYGSGLDLLRQTPAFIEQTLDQRLGHAFGHAYRYVEPLFGGVNPYMGAIRQNINYLRTLARSSRWPLLRRNPPVFTVDDRPMDSVRRLLVRHLREMWTASAAAAAPVS